MPQLSGGIFYECAWTMFRSMIQMTIPYIWIFFTNPTEAARRKSLPAWIREGLERMDKEKAKKEEREKKMQEYAEEKKKRMEEERKIEEEIKREKEDKGKRRKSRFDVEEVPVQKSREERDDEDGEEREETRTKKMSQISEDNEEDDGEQSGVEEEPEAVTEEELVISRLAISVAILSPINIEFIQNQFVTGVGF